MSLPNIPDIRPDIDLSREDVINLLLGSIALEEIGLAHIINAEGEKIQEVLKGNHVDFHHMIEINDSAEKMLQSVIKKEILLQFKFDQVVELIKEELSTK